MKVGDLVKQISWDGVGLVTKLASHPHRDEVDFVRVQYNDVTDWIAVENLEIVNEGR